MRLNQQTIGIIRKLLVARKGKTLHSILSRISPHDLSSLYVILSHREARWLLETLVQTKQAAGLLAELPEEDASQVIETMESDWFCPMIAEAEDELALKVLRRSPAILKELALSKIPAPRAKRFKKLLDYAEGTAGQLMDTEIFSLPVSLTAREALERVRVYAQDSSIYYLYITTPDETIVGVISLRVLVTCNPDTLLGTLCSADSVISVPPETTTEELGALFRKHGFIALPVVDSNQRFIGITTIDDVMDQLQEEADAKALAQVGLQEDERFFTPAFKSFKNRIPWMLLNLGIAMCASLVVSFFETTISQLIVLASMNNLVAGIGGNAGVQTLAVSLRSLSLGDLEIIPPKQAIIGQTTITLFVGLFMGTFTGLVAYFWKGSLIAAIALGLALFINCVLGGFIGALAPIAMKKFGKDPGLGSGILLSALTDVFGFLSFLGIATLLLHLFGAAL